MKEGESHGVGKGLAAREILITPALEEREGTDLLNKQASF